MRNKYNRHIGREAGRYYKSVGKEIGRAVRDAVRSGDMEGIGRAVENGVRKFARGNKSFDGRGNGDRSPVYTYGQPGPQDGAPENGADERRDALSAFRSRMPGGISGFVFTAIGASVGIPLLIADIVVAGVAAAGSMSLPELTIAGSALIPITAAALGLMSFGIALRRRARRFARYRDAMGGAAFCALDQLAGKAGETPERARKDLKKMIACGACPQGHLDRGETCFMVDDRTYDEYLQAEKAYETRMEAERAQERKEETDPKEAELENVKKEGTNYLQQIRTANDALPGEVISEKLDRLENVTARIFECVRQHPEKLPDIRRFIRYYMPTTLKLVKTYEEFESQPVQGENITQAKKEIERALDTVNMAFENLLDSLFANDALDVSTDISTLETMLKQEGLTGSDFAKAPDGGKLS